MTARCIVCGEDAAEQLPEASKKLADQFLQGMEAFGASRGPLQRVDFPVVRCLNCGFIFVAGARQQDQDAQRWGGPPTAEEWARAHYADPGLDIERKRREEMDACAPLLESIESLATTGRLLEIGAGLGWFLAAARERGWQVTGTDLNDVLIEYMRSQLGLEILRGHLCDLGLQAGYYDVVAMFDVLEHLFDVEETLAEVRRILTPGGLLVIRVPNAGGLRARIHFESWNHLAPWHVSYFSDATLSALLTRVGFSVLATESGAPDSFAVLARDDPRFSRLLAHPDMQELLRRGCYGDLLLCFARNEPARRTAWRLAGWDSAVADLEERNEVLSTELARISAEAERMSQQLGRIYSRWPVRAYLWLKRLGRGRG